MPLLLGRLPKSAVGLSVAASVSGTRGWSVRGRVVGDPEAAGVPGRPPPRRNHQPWKRCAALTIKAAILNLEAGLGASDVAGATALALGGGEDISGVGTFGSIAARELLLLRRPAVGCSSSKEAHVGAAPVRGVMYVAQKDATETDFGEQHARGDGWLVVEVDLLKLKGWSLCFCLLEQELEALQDHARNLAS